MATTRQQWMQVPRFAVEDLHWLARGESPTTDRVEGVLVAATWLLAEDRSWSEVAAELDATRFGQETWAGGAWQVLHWAATGKNPPIPVPWRHQDGTLMDAVAIAVAMAGPAGLAWERERLDPLRRAAIRDAERSRELAARIDEARREAGK